MNALQQVQQIKANKTPISQKEELRLFNLLTKEERQLVADVDNSCEPSLITLSIYSTVWVYLPQLDRWELIERQANLQQTSYYPECLYFSDSNINYLYVVEQNILYKQI